MIVGQTAKAPLKTQVNFGATEEEMTREINKEMKRQRIQEKNDTRLNQIEEKVDLLMKAHPELLEKTIGIA